MKELRRHSFAIRVTHWLMAGAFVVLLASGAAFWSPRLAWLTQPLGGGFFARWLHPWVGLLFSGCLGVLGLAWVRRMGFGADDWRFLSRFGTYLRHGGDLPEAGKFHAGQKLYFWAAVGSGAVLLCTGLILWFPAWDLGAQALNVSRLLHAAGFLVLTAGLIYHVYLSTLAFPGTLRAMVRGTVGRRWAKRHHARWVREQDEG